VPAIAEIVGLAGVGKTTLSLALSQRDQTIHGSFALHPLAFMPTYLVRAILSLPGRLSRHHDKQQISWETLRIMVYLEKLYRVLSRYKPGDSAIFVLDQGPVFLLAYLQQFGFEGIGDGDRNLELWRRSMIDKWASVLDYVFWIEAPDIVLLERILHRERWHRIKDMSEQEARVFLERYRETYDWVIPQFTSKGRTQVISFSSDEEPVDRIVDKIVGILTTG
jgi:adenylate kinase family enzyme